MAKKPSPAKKPAKKSAQPKRATTKAAPAKKKTAKKKLALKATASAAKASPTKKSPVTKTIAKPAASKKPANKQLASKQPAARKSKPAKQAAEGYLATLNHWRQSAVAGVRTIVQKPAATTRGLWQQVPAPRKLLQETGAKLRQVKLSRLKDAGKKELQELIHLAARLREIGHTPRPASGRAKRK